ncbi:hypothetical protein [Labrys sp. 22185]|uniref:hypothetical protein n=1 Tax=Labrys sp. 22185 TaxID=3453888 RepID=UPI003F82C0DF
MAKAKQTRIERNFFRMFDAAMARIEESRHQAALSETERAAEAEADASAAARPCVSTTGVGEKGRETLSGQGTPSGQLSANHNIARS